MHDSASVTDLRRSSIGGSTIENEILRAEIVARWHLGLCDDVLFTVFKQNANTDVRTHRNSMVPLRYAIKYHNFVWTIFAIKNRWKTYFLLNIERFVDVSRFDEWSPENWMWEISEIKNNHYLTNNCVRLVYWPKYSNWSILRATRDTDIIYV